MIPVGDEEALFYFQNYKWKEPYTCKKCGFDNYKKGKKPYSRKCSKCDYDESVLKATAFEGLHLPPGKIYTILQHLAEYTHLDVEAKVFPLKKMEEPSGRLTEKEIKLIADGKPVSKPPYSLIDVIEREKAKEDYDPERLDEKLTRLLASYKPTVGKLSKQFEVEENTVVKLLSRIQSRQYLDKSSEFNAEIHVIAYLNVPDIEKKMTKLLEICLTPIYDEK